MAIIIIVLIIFIAILVTNLRKSKLEEDILTQNNKQLRNLMNALPDIICFKDSDGKYISMNKTCKDVLELNSQSYIGKTNIDLVEFIPKHEKVLRNFANSDKTAWKKGESRNEEVIIMSNGEKKVFDVIKVPIFNKDGSRRGVGVFGRDITENKVSEKVKKKLEKVKENDKLKTEFFVNVSHELRTPLNVMLSSIQLIQLYISKGKILDDENNLCKNIKILRQNALRLLKLINNLIDITKIDGGFYVLDLKNCDIVSLIEDITMSVVEYVESNDINLIFDTDVEEKVLACDPEKIERIMLNLLSNAAKFTPRNGCIKVNLTDKDDKFLISVKDTGIGIPLEQQKDIFERFKQINGTSVNNYQGSRSEERRVGKECRSRWSP